MSDDADLLRACGSKQDWLRKAIATLHEAFRGSVPGKTSESSDLLDSLEILPGHITLPNGTAIPEEQLDSYLAAKRAGDFELEDAQDEYLAGPSINNRLAELRDLVNSANWLGATDVAGNLYGNLMDEPPVESEKPLKVHIICSKILSELEFLAGARYSPLWVPDRGDVLPVEVFREVDRKIAEGIVANSKILDSLDPRFFEELIASIFHSVGFEVFLTTRTRDGGRDIIAIGQTNTVLLKYIIECKRYRKDRKIAVRQVRELYGVKVSERVSKAILATTSGFTKTARQFAEKHIWELQLIERRQLLRMIARYASGPIEVVRNNRLTYRLSGPQPLGIAPVNSKALSYTKMDR